ncbi:hypothetical protein FPOAC2_01115 [Fusarium poae]|uniref:2-oxoadipate dioxygenase/decarboxylase n=1 Tax=Fusarium poae TaxID=36050 RepID=A0A1B8B2D4_FUSPO|nr:hypothetical protein FPOAC1_001049 [Fusarium poae]KAG8675072.1 hypothetical protein FPOAC1_001049 [Fusarium poae]OBS26881.1 hypothetical protein FPOA_00824 [Fusarium poae]
MPTLQINASTITASVRSRDNDFASPEEVRTTFTLAMSTMYRNEVPLYGDLIRIVDDVNEGILSEQPGSTKERLLSQRLDVERHGAIRLGTPYELRTVARLFSILGLKAVGYYDLSVAGLPMHATCFRPVDYKSLDQNPFRVFTTLLRPDLITDPDTRELTSKLLSKRDIFSPKLLDFINKAETNGRLLRISDVSDFIAEAIKTFSWEPEAFASEEEYKQLAQSHPILADIASFKSAHINHLTPRTLDITRSQQQMKEEGLRVKHRIEGPPLRQCPILLRQTSFLALEERIQFRNGLGVLVEGTHRARFGEIEERGAAVTPAGRKLYDDLLNTVMKKISQSLDTQSPEAIDATMAEVFRDYPDSWSELRKQDLIYRTYHRTSKQGHNMSGSDSLEELVEQGYLTAEPITYEDFLPFSAAGIFASNLGNSQQDQPQGKPRSDQAGLESALGYATLDADKLYLEIQNESIKRCGLHCKLTSRSVYSAPDAI